MKFMRAQGWFRGPTGSLSYVEWQGVAGNDTVLLFFPGYTLDEFTSEIFVESILPIADVIGVNPHLHEAGNPPHTPDTIATLCDEMLATRSYRMVFIAGQSLGFLPAVRLAELFASRSSDVGFHVIGVNPVYHAHNVFGWRFFWIDRSIHRLLRTGIGGRSVRMLLPVFRSSKAILMMRASVGNYTYPSRLLSAAVRRTSLSHDRRTQMLSEALVYYPSHYRSDPPALPPSSVSVITSSRDPFIRYSLADPLPKEDYYTTLVRSFGNICGVHERLKGGHEGLLEAPSSWLRIILAVLHRVRKAQVIDA